MEQGQGKEHVTQFQPFEKKTCQIPENFAPKIPKHATREKPSQDLA